MVRVGAAAAGRFQAVPHNAADLTEADLRTGQTLWATIDAPWLHKTDDNILAGELDTVRDRNPSMILSSHLPAAPGNMTGRLVGTLPTVPTSEGFVGPDQPALEQMLTQMTGAAG